jgi:hypothetical protein
MKFFGQSIEDHVAGLAELVGLSLERVRGARHLGAPLLGRLEAQHHRAVYGAGVNRREASAAEICSLATASDITAVVDVVQLLVYLERNRRLS